MPFLMKIISATTDQNFQRSNLHVTSHKESSKIVFILNLLFNPKKFRLVNFSKNFVILFA